MDQWHLMHDYRRAVSIGLLSPERCGMCNEPLRTTIGHGDRPALTCYADNLVVHLSDRWFKDTEKKLKELHE